MIVLATSVSGCLRIDEYTRTERGPSLGNATRTEIHPGRVDAQLDVRWPNLEIDLTASDVCRTQTFQTFNEEQVVERRSQATGPALSLGMSGLVAGGALWGFSYAASNEPQLDRSGRSSPSAQALMRAWSVGALIVAIPALAVGIIGAMASGETVQSQKIEQLLSESDRPCHERPLSGPVALLASTDLLSVSDARDGKAQFDLTKLQVAPMTIAFAGQPISLSDANVQVLDALTSCLTANRWMATKLSDHSYDALFELASLLRSCREVRGDEMQQSIEATDAELVRRRGL